MDSAKHLYFDYSATAPLDPAVLQAMLPYFSERFGNPGSVHHFGREALAAVDEAREKISKVLGCSFRDVIFTGSATEANNLFLRGAVKAALRKNNSRRSAWAPNIIVSSIEHESVLETAHDLEKDGIETHLLPVGPDGIVSPGHIKALIDENTVLVSVMYANNVIGSIQPIADIAKIISDFRASANRQPPTANRLIFHTDAVQAFAYLPCGIKNLGVDALTISAHKLGGPKGVGVLCLNLKSEEAKHFELKAIFTGGPQEFNLRAGTENVAGIVGACAAIVLADEARAKEARRLESLKVRLWGKIRAFVPGAQLNPSSGACDLKKYLPSILNIHLPYGKANQLVLRLDALGAAVSAGAACSARTERPSYVFDALHQDEALKKGNIRISMGKNTAESEIDELAEKIKIVTTSLGKVI